MSDGPVSIFFYIYINECLLVCLCRMRSYTIQPIATKLWWVVVRTPAKVSELVKPFYNIWRASRFNKWVYFECFVRLSRMRSYTIQPIAMKLWWVVVCTPAKVSELVQSFYSRWRASRFNKWVYSNVLFVCPVCVPKPIHPNNITEATNLNGKFKGEDVLLPRIPMIPTDMPFEFKRLQFSVRLAFAMTINKAQGPSLQVCGLNLKNPCFSHGQLYVACSRVGKPSNLFVYAPEGKTKNIMYPKALQ